MKKWLHLYRPLQTFTARLWEPCRKLLHKLVVLSVEMQCNW